MSGEARLAGGGGGCHLGPPAGLMWSKAAARGVSLVVLTSTFTVSCREVCNPRV